ncbi:FtsX-like permease family protein [Nocardioides sp. Leaf307]|uniref:FtsX-like permease family protein n=1 Tax=Nocardioides sp. Leaf307 TaxID=1736331 RepID=UPI000702F776|nr:FtsX-like permease family protein [Nocardioides sp. Leaf307]KQQ39476.1 hypothetical protein ASF50_16260 [Nocardioides sp. Leaf307]
MRGPLAGWRLPLRLAWRDARRAKGRSLLVLVMIALPVLAVSAASVLYTTQEVSPVEGLDRRLGSAQALVRLDPGDRAVEQGVDPFMGFTSTGARREPGRPTLAQVRQALGEPDAPAVQLSSGSYNVRTDGGEVPADITETDLLDPLTRGLVELVDGRLPRSAGEVVVNPELARRDAEPGQQLTLRNGAVLDVVGIAESTSYTGYPQAWTRPGSTRPGADPDAGPGEGPRSTESTWLVGGAPVTWQDVRALNAIGAVALSRAVVTDPPPSSAIPPAVRSAPGGLDEATVTVLVLVVVMVLIEVVLLAGPAFAVGARRQSRTLALFAAAGGVPRQARRVVLASGVVLGLAGALLGVVLGLIAALPLLPVLQGFSTTRFGPFEVSWWQLAVIALFGVVSALLAAAVPAWIASRQDVVAVLAGRRGDTRASRRSPLLGVVLLGAGVAGAAWGAVGGGNEIAIAASAVVSVLGMVLLVPVVVVAVARLATRLPLALRFAARDAARHRTRTVPAVAAVAATVAGVVALGIGLSSDEHQNEATYRPTAAEGAMLVTSYDRPRDWDAYRASLADTLPGAEVTAMEGLVLREGGTRAELSVLAGDGDGSALQSWGGAFDASVLVADVMPRALLGGVVDGPAMERADAVLAAGGVVAFADRPVEGDEARLVARTYRERGGPETVASVRADADWVEVPNDWAPVLAVVPSSVATELGGSASTVGLLVPGPVDTAAEERADEALTALPGSPTTYVERGYQADEAAVVVQLILAALGAVLMLGGTLTATFLALSDARPDLATLSAVGASPRTRRAIAAAYALVVGLVGAVLGALVGAIPGVAITYPLTGPGSSGTTGGPATYLDVPWLLVTGVVLGLPLLTAAVVGLTARSRLPLVARLD